MSKLYLEVLDGRNLSVDYIELNIVDDFSEDMTYRQFKELSAEILEAVKKCAEANNINLGHKYNKLTDGVDMCRFKKYSTRVFVENGKHFNSVIIEYDSYFDIVDLNWSNFSYYDAEYKIAFKKISD